MTERQYEPLPTLRKASDVVDWSTRLLVSLNKVVQTVEKYFPGGRYGVLSPRVVSPPQVPVAGGIERILVTSTGQLIFSDGTVWRSTGSAALFGDITGGTVDATGSIQKAIDAASAAGGGVIQLGPGIYLLDPDTDVALAIPSNVTLMGSGPYATTLKLANGADAHVINVASDASNVAIGALKIDGNRANQSVSVHGIRSTAVANFLLENLWVVDAAGYGIGLQGGTKNNLRARGIVIERSGSDGFDIKNTDDDNVGMVLSDITVRQHGLNTDLPAQAGIDVRGPAVMSNITVIDVGTGTGIVGIRFRAGETGDASGLGGHFSSLCGFHVTGSEAGTTGLFMAARRCSVSSGVIEGVDTAVSITQADNALAGVVASLCISDGFQVLNSAEATNADRCTLTGCIARSCGDEGYIIQGDQNLFTGCIARSCGGSGFEVETGATENKFGNCLSASNGVADVDNGTSTVGWPP